MRSSFRGSGSGGGSGGGSGSVKGSGLLTIEQVERRRNLMTTSQLALFVLCGYYIIGLLYYSVGGDNLRPLDTIYFATQTLASVGYGDINIHLHRNHYAFTGFFCLLGAGLVAVHFSCLASNLVQRQEQALKDGLNKIHDKIKQHVIQNNEKTMTLQELEEGLIRNKNKKIDVAELYNELFNQELREIRSAVILNVFLVLLVILVGGGIMASIEGLSYTDGVYWACATVTTTGYGDVVAVTDNGKIFTIIYILTSVGVALKGFAEIVRYPIVLRAKKNELEVSKQFISDISPSTIKNILKNDFFDRIENLRKSPTTVQKSEFVLMLLQMMGKTSEKDIVFIARVFDSLDANGSGEISEEQLNAAMIQAKERERIRLIEEQKEMEQGLGLGLGLDNLAIGALGDITTGLGTLGSGLGTLGSAVGNGLGSLTMGLLGKKETDSSPITSEVDNPIHTSSYKSVSRESTSRRSTPGSPPPAFNNVEIPLTPLEKSTYEMSSQPNDGISDLMDVDLSSVDISNIKKLNQNTELTYSRPHGYTALEILGADLIDYSIDSEQFGDDVLESPITQATRSPQSVNQTGRKLDYTAP